MGWVLDAIGAATAAFLYWRVDPLFRFRDKARRLDKLPSPYVGGLIALPRTTTYGMTALWILPDALVLGPRFRWLRWVEPTWVFPRSDVNSVQSVRVLGRSGIRICVGGASTILALPNGRNQVEQLLTHLEAEHYPISRRQQRASPLKRKQPRPAN